MERKSVFENITGSNQISVELLIVDAQTALTLLDLADTTRLAEDRSRRIREAHRAYQTILSFLVRLSLTAQQMRILSADLETIRARLRAAGVVID